MRTIQLGLCAVAALASAGCADTVVNPTELAMPPSITTKMAKGFTLYMVKAILSGREGRGHRPRPNKFLQLAESWVTSHFERPPRFEATFARDLERDFLAVLAFAQR